MEPMAYAHVSDGQDEWYLWFRLCATPACACRDAVVLATREGEDMLVPIAMRIDQAWREGEGPRARARALTGGPVLGFSMDLNSAAVQGLEDEDPPEEADDIAALIDGDLLDALHRRWRGSKGMPPEPPLGNPELSRKLNWKPGDMVGWREAFPEDRSELLWDGTRWVDAYDLHCVMPGCTCQVSTLLAIDPKTGKQLVKIQIDLGKKEPPLLEDEDAENFWEGWEERNPNWRARLASRQAAIKAYGALLLPKAAAPAAKKVGRNEACPCGSGKKFKRCCGS